MRNVAFPSEPLWDAGRRVAARLLDAGHETYFAGGMVRDLLLGRKAKDVDIATSATPVEVEALFRRVVTVGAQFGVAKVVEPPFEIEVATFRVDGPYSDGRRPDSVRFASAREDALRRDFTVNGMFLHPREGQLVDYVGGEQDLGLRTIRAIGDARQRFVEDKLRMLRAVRLAAQLGFDIEPATWGELQRMAAEVRSVSAERIREEIVRILMSADPARGIRLCKDAGLLHHILPEVEAMDGVAQPPEFHPEGDVFTHTLLLLEKTEGMSLVVKLGALLHDVGKPPTFQVADRIRFNGHDRVGAEMTDALMRRLRFGNEERERVVALVAEHMRFPVMPEMRKSTLKRFLALPHFEDHLELHRIDCQSSHGNLALYDFARAKLDELGREGVDPEPLLRGRDLIAMGYRPGPQFGAMLERVREAQLEGEIGDAEAARALVTREFPRTDS